MNPHQPRRGGGGGWGGGLICTLYTFNPGVCSGKVQYQHVTGRGGRGGREGCIHPLTQSTLRRAGRFLTVTAEAGVVANDNSTHTTSGTGFVMVLASDPALRSGGGRGATAWRPGSETSDSIGLLPIDSFPESHSRCG